MASLKPWRPSPRTISRSNQCSIPLQVVRPAWGALLRGRLAYQAYSPGRGVCLTALGELSTWSRRMPLSSAEFKTIAANTRKSASAHPQPTLEHRTPKHHWKVRPPQSALDARRPRSRISGIGASGLDKTDGAGRAEPRLSHATRTSRQQVPRSSTRHPQHPHAQPANPPSPSPDTIDHSQGAPLPWRPGWAKQLPGPWAVPDAQFSRRAVF